MEAILNRGIKEIIDSFPEVAGLLDEYGIGCGPCNVGTCLLKDIVEIHNLSPDDERELLTRIVKAVDPDAKVELSIIEKEAKPFREGITYSPPMQKLVNEHVFIKKLVDAIPDFAARLDVETKEGNQSVQDALVFIRSYADRYHHAKEEDILFKYFDEDLDILKAMLQDHETGRGFVRDTLEALARKDRQAVVKNLMGYHDLLTEHIKKEDEILYPWMDRNLSDTQVGQLYAKFAQTDVLFGAEPRKYERFADELEQRIKTEEVA